MSAPAAANPESKPVLNFLRYWGPVLVWFALIFTASADTKSAQHSSFFFAPLMRWLFPHLPPDTLDECHHLFRKCCHLAEYAILGALFWRAIRQPVKGDPRPWNWAEAGLSLSGVFAYAATDEFHQIFVPTRTPAVTDVMIDTCGGALSLLLLWLWTTKIRPAKPASAS
jgi:VanZ family protein